MKIFVDDVRDPPDDTWILVTTYESAIDLISHNYLKINEISLDHDLGGEYDGVTVHKTGYDIATVIESIAFKTGYVPKIKVHSMNPVGASNILACIKAIQKTIAEYQKKK